MNENTNIIDVTETEFNDQVIEASENRLIIVDFWAPWCGPCKQLTPILEKIVKSSVDKVKLVKINIDDNQQIAAQLRIQSIPAVFAFKDKQIVNAFQGVLPEKQIQEFIEKCLGSKLSEDFTEFYDEIKHNMSENKFEETKDILLEFISKNNANSTWRNDGSGRYRPPYLPKRRVSSPSTQMVAHQPRIHGFCGNSIRCCGNWIGIGHDFPLETSNKSGDHLGYILCFDFPWKYFTIHQWH